MNIENLENEIQSWVAVKSFAVEDAHPQLPIIDANELAEMLSSVFKKLEGCVVVPVDRINKLVATIEGMFEDDPTLALGELLPIQQDIKAMVEAVRGENHE